MATTLGEILELNVYPVKSMQGISVAEADCYWYGLNDDRKYAFVQENKHSGFPWLTAREHPELLLYKTSFDDPENSLSSKIQVETPKKQTRALDSAELRHELQHESGLGIYLLKLNRGTFDCMPLSIMTTSTLEKLELLLGALFDRSRFRFNVLIESSAEDETLLGKSLSLGNEVSVSLNYLTKRCIMINLDPNTAQTNPSVLKTVVQSMNAHAGIYASIQSLGKLCVGDTVRLKG